MLFQRFLLHYHTHSFSCILDLLKLWPDNNRVINLFTWFTLLFPFSQTYTEMKITFSRRWIFVTNKSLQIYHTFYLLNLSLSLQQSLNFTLTQSFIYTWYRVNVKKALYLNVHVLVLFKWTSWKHLDFSLTYLDSYFFTLEIFVLEYVYLDLNC